MCSHFAVWPFVWPTVAVPLHCLAVQAELRAPIVRRPCSSSVSCGPCGAYPTRTCMTGSRVGLLWPWPVACLSTNKDSLASPAPHSSANVATLPERLCMSHFLSCSFYKLSDDDSSELVISSLIVLPSWPGDAVIPMLPSGMLPLTILVHGSRGFRVHTLICRGSGLRLFSWIHGVLGAVAVIPWNPKNQKNRSCLPPSWTTEELGKRSSIERFFGRVFLFFHLQRPPLCGWS